MFVETVTAPHDEWERWTERLRILSEPPTGLVASIAWRTDDGRVTAVNLWDSPEAVGDFFMARVNAIPEADREQVNKPTRHGTPVAVYIRA